MRFIRATDASSTNNIKMKLLVGTKGQFSFFSSVSFLENRSLYSYSPVIMTVVFTRKYHGLLKWGSLGNCTEKLKPNPMTKLMNVRYTYKNINKGEKSCLSL